MRLTEAQKREKAMRVALARSSAELGLTNNQQIASYIQVPYNTYCQLRFRGFVGDGLTKFCNIAQKLKFTDDEILRIVRAKE